MNRTFILLLISPSLICILGCSAIIDGPTLPPRSIWDDCFVGRFIDTDTATIFLTHNRSLVTIIGQRDPSNAAPWDTLSYVGQTQMEGEILGELTLTFPEVRTTEPFSTVRARDGRTGDEVVKVTFLITGVSGLECTPRTTDFIEISFAYIWDGEIFSETIAAERE